MALSVCTRGLPPLVGCPDCTAAHGLRHAGAGIGGGAPQPSAEGPGWEAYNVQRAACSVQRVPARPRATLWARTINKALQSVQSVQSVPRMCQSPAR
jgi:hypothetical protein